MTFRVEDDSGILAEGKDLAALKEQLRSRSQAAVARAADDLERHGLTSWDFDTLSRTVERTVGGYPVTAYPALVDEGESVGIGVFDSEAEQWSAMWRGTRRLLRLAAPPPLKSLQGRLSNQTKLALSRNPHGSVAALLDDCVTTAIDQIIIEAGGPAWDKEAFATLAATARARLFGVLHETLSQLEPILRSWHDIDRRLRTVTNVLMVRSVSDLRTQTDALIHPGFVATTGLRRLPDLARYLRGAEIRLTKLAEHPQRDRERLAKLEEVLDEYEDCRKRVRPGGPGWDTLQQVRWMIEELRISYFAQELGTAYAVSDVRIYRALATIP